ncbi:MAG: DbpA RNA binding domain-containing protein, partial [Proteobacteria bacterium]|nr:DbpA RNA binding domain-containing protein [Pseudomonadota bacterium]
AGKGGMAFSLMTPKERFRLADINCMMGSRFEVSDAGSLVSSGDANPLPAMVTLSINGWRKAKLRPGDILGALTREGGIPGSRVGKIDCFAFYSYVAVERCVADEAQKTLSSEKIKGCYFIIHRHE